MSSRCITTHRSCWLELAELCVAEKQALPTWPEITAASSSEPPQSQYCADSSYCSAAGGEVGAGGSAAQLQEAKIMYACFLVHAYLEKHCGDLAMQVQGGVHCAVLVLPAPVAACSWCGCCSCCCHTRKLKLRSEIMLSVVMNAAWGRCFVLYSVRSAALSWISFVRWS
jgi:hypothetical protein